MTDSQGWEPIDITVRGGCSSVLRIRALLHHAVRSLISLSSVKLVSLLLTLTRALSSPHSIVKDLHGTALAPALVPSRPAHWLQGRARGTENDERSAVRPNARR